MAGLTSHRNELKHLLETYRTKDPRLTEILDVLLEDVHETIIAVNPPPTAPPGTSIPSPPHKHKASEISFEPAGQYWTGYIAEEDVQAVGQEIDDEKLARSGVQPMLGNLDMNHFDVNNIKDAEIESNLTFSGDVGAARVINPRVVEMNPAVAAGVDYTAAEGKVSWDTLEDTLIAYVASGAGVILIALGWSVKLAVSG